MKHFKSFKSEKNLLTVKQLRAINGGDDAPTTTEQEELEKDRGGGRPKTNG
ncbi:MULTISPECIES: hypothetical protein [Flavobacterium]|uniref:Bacteriocin-type signal sequence-containing protein n=1 Tax=Flavobacterium jumunjinense TaxID=998845 RepID=A0ABV5GVK7_9FLAO|nr:MULTISPECIES: hypothetical protein [Flavobacterium]